jgi:hypothetical protein
MQDNKPHEPTYTPSGPAKETRREQKNKGEGVPTMALSDPKQIIADAIRLRVVTVSRDQSKYAAEDVLAGLKKAGYELWKK